MATTDEMNRQLDEFRAGVERLRAEVAKVIVGQEEIVVGTLTALIAGGPSCSKDVSAMSSADFASG